MLCHPAKHFAADCPSRILIDQVVDKWSMMVMAVLENEPQRFNAIKRSLEGVTQKALTQCLRRLERNGLVTRHVIPISPVAVAYQITPLGQTLVPAFRTFYQWALSNVATVEAARVAYDTRAESEREASG